VIKTPKFTPVMRLVFSEIEYNSTVAIKNAAMYVMLNGRLKGISCTLENEYSTKIHYYLFLSSDKAHDYLSFALPSLQRGCP